MPPHPQWTYWNYLSADRCLLYRVEPRRLRSYWTEEVRYACSSEKTCLIAYVYYIRAHCRDVFVGCYCSVRRLVSLSRGLATPTLCQNCLLIMDAADNDCAYITPTGSLLAGHHVRPWVTGRARMNRATASHQFLTSLLVAVSRSNFRSRGFGLD